MNNQRRANSIALHECGYGSVDPTPGTVAGARALVEMYYALKRAGVLAATPEVGGGVAGGIGVYTSPTSPGPKKIKSTLIEVFPA